MPAAPLPLSEYLDRIESACRPPREWTMACETVMESVGHVLDDHYGTSGPKIKAQGSYVQSLMIRGSDLDLVLYRKGRSVNSCSKNCVKRYLTTTTDAVVRSLNHLNGDVKARVKQRILHARVPIVKLVFEVRSEMIDLEADEPSSPSSAASTTSSSSENSDGVSIKTVKPQTVEVDMSYGDEQRGECDAVIQNLISSGGEVCHKFVTLVKLWGRISGATDSFNNCLSTFALILLAIYHFKSVDIIEKRKRKGENRPIDVAFLLSSFFHWVAFNFHCEDVEIDVEEHKMHSRLPSTYCPMFIRVPRDSFANAARCLSNSQWRNRVLPAFRSAAHSCRGSRWTELFGDKVTRLIPSSVEELVESSEDSSDVDSLEEIEVVKEKRRKIAKWRQDSTTLSLSSSDSSSGSEEIVLSDGVEEDVVEVGVSRAGDEMRNGGRNRRGKKRAIEAMGKGTGNRRNRKKFKTAVAAKAGDGGMDGSWSKRMSGKKRARLGQRQKRKQNQRSF
ncbi:hypothetical protein FOZ63_028975 [Perkinsus olseni]|uniref:Poly(A) RNA polymerase mitochondrial-like central palm domain-containing protein n=1 Tax=Perkinsus olseni TaxID=32597 RepID=A0A7J6RW40_PEROL|nr:hypothetical protein FOZ63_028975 [Perkinsus olseni]